MRNVNLFSFKSKWLNFFIIILFCTINNSALSQCSTYQVYESFLTTLPTQGGTWEQNSISYSSASVRSGANNLSFNSNNDFIRTPLIENPGILSFWFRRSGTSATHGFTIETSTDNTTWITRDSYSGTMNTSYIQRTLDLGALSLSNVYVRVRDTRTSGATLWYLDDLSWTSTVSNQNNVIVPSLGTSNCTSSLDCGVTYKIYDVGGISDQYSISQNNTIILQPSTSGKTIEVTINNLATESSSSCSDWDWLKLFEGNSISGTLLNWIQTGCATRPIPSGAVTSSDVNGNLTVQFKSDSGTNAAGFEITAVCVDPLTPCSAPADQPTSLLAGTSTSTSIMGSFNAAPSTPSGYLVVRSVGSLNTDPVDGTTYSTGNTLGNGTVIQSNSNLTFTGSSLTSNTEYTITIFSYNNTSCSGGPAYLVTTPLIGNATTCPAAPTSAVNSNLSSSGFTVSWTASAVGGSAGTINYSVEVYTDAAYTSPVAGSPFSALTNTSQAVSALSANTTYYYRINANNGSCNSTYLTGSVFTGYCTPAPSSVDGLGITNVTFGVSPNIVNNTTVAESGNYGNYSVQIGNIQQTIASNVSITYQTGATYDTKIWIDLNNDLDFDDTGEDVYTGVSTSSNPTTLIASITLPISVPVGNYRMRIGGRDLGAPTPCYTGTWGAYEDYTVNVTAAPSCLPPTTLLNTSVTTTTANHSWLAPSPTPGVGYEWAVTTSATPPASGTPTTNLTESSTSLTSNTTYYLHVRSECTAGVDYSPWGTSASFYTGYCLASSTSQASWISNFSTTGGTINITHTAASGAAGGYINLIATNTVSNYIGQTTNFSITSGGPTVGNAIWVDWNNNLLFETGERMYVSTTYGTTVTGSFSIPAATPNGNYRMRVITDYNNSAPSNSCGNIDRGEFKDFNFEVVSPPSCLPPSALIISNITNNSANIAWTAPSPAPGVGYEWAVTTSATPPASGAQIAATSTTATSLTGNTVYYLHVRSECTAGVDYSTWATSASFTTQLVVPAPYNEPFTSTSTPLGYNITGWTIGSIRGVTGNSGNNIYKNLYGSATTGTFTTVNVGPISAGMFLTFDYKNSNYDPPYAAPGTGTGNFAVSVSTDFGATYTVISTIGNSASNAWQQYSQDLSAYAGQNVKIRIVGTWLSGDYDLAFDNIKIETPPSCLPPSALTISNIANNSADISWTAPTPVPGVGYEWAVTSSATPPANGMQSTATATSATSLTGNTIYYLHVRSECTAGVDYSTWATSTSFKTLCDAVNLPYSMPITAVTAPALPECTTLEDLGNLPNTWRSYASTSIPGWTAPILAYPYNSTNPANDWLYTAGLNLTAGVNYRVTFKYNNDGSIPADAPDYYPEKMKVSYGTSATSAGMTTLLQDYPVVANETPQKDTLYFTAPSTGVYYVGFHAYSDADQDFLILDDVEVVEVPCTTVTSTADSGNGSLRAALDCVIDGGTVTISGITSLITDPIFIDKNVTIIGAGTGVIDFNFAASGLTAGTYGLQVAAGKTVTLSNVNVVDRANPNAGTPSIKPVIDIQNGVPGGTLLINGSTTITKQ